jgi:predicted DNA-binding protein with PD1-like motif
MQSKEKKNVIFIRLFPDEDINEQLKKACKLHEVKTAVVISGIGQFKKVQLGYFKEKGNYSSEIFEKPLELLSLTGNICKQGKNYILHLHVVLGDENKNTIGGHFIEGKISVTGEIVLFKTTLDVHRKLDKKTGLKILYIE